MIKSAFLPILNFRCLHYLQLIVANFSRMNPNRIEANVERWLFIVLIQVLIRKIAIIE